MTFKQESDIIRKCPWFPIKKHGFVFRKFKKVRKIAVFSKLGLAF